MLSRRHVAHVALLVTLASASLFGGALTPAAQAGFGVTESNFEAGTCNTPSCTYKGVEKNHSEAFIQAAGHPSWGITGFELNHTGEGSGRVPEGELKRLRVDVPPGLAADPQALPECSMAEFEANSCPADTKVGKTELEAHVLLTVINIPGTVYNLQKRPGLPLLFGINTGLEPLVDVHIFLEGHVSDAHENVLAARGVPSGDYHEYFEIDNVPKEGEMLGVKVPIAVVKSKLLFEGRAGQGNFLTLPSVCSGTTTSYLEVESYNGEVSSTATHPPVGIEGCDKVPFKPTVTVTPENSSSDQPDGSTADVMVPQNVGAEEINTADIRDAHVTLPEGMTLNPSAAHGLQACTAAQINIGTTAPVTCPAGSKVGAVTIETDLPPGSLTGSVYLGSPSGGPITEPPYTIYLDAESTLGVSVRLQGSVTPDPSTGRLQATFANNPQLPFSDLILKFKGGPLAPVANPLACGATSVETLFTPYTGLTPALSVTPFTTTGCPSPLPFSLKQSTQSSSADAGAYTSYTFNLNREDGQQYLSRLATALPPGLVGAIPSVPLCGEPQAQAGTCAATSEIGKATVNVGAGSEPYSFTGPVYLTGPYNGAPYGLSVAVAAVAGPFDLGTVVTRVGIGVDPYTARVIATSSLPTIVKGVPLRLKSLSVAVTRANFLFNPTNCAALASESTLTSTFGTTQQVSSPFQATNCAALAFKPSFKVSTAAKTSKLNGASLQVDLTQPAHQANIRSVFAQLPVQLPARLTTLQKACPEATFAQNPRICPAGSLVGGASVTTPVLPGKLSGPAYLVSHGGLAFPDLDLILEGDGVRVVLTGNTNIKKGITSSTFAAIPDVPVSSFALNLPVGPHSALAANGSLCAGRLAMPTTIVAQNGKQVKQSTTISVTGCPVRIIRHRVRGNAVYLTVQTYAPGRLSGKGSHLTSVSRGLGQARKAVTLQVPLSRAGRRHKRPLKVRVRVGFVPKNQGEPRSVASVTVRFK
ncbi:MAG TPA: hypothetical protein VG053_03805 [Solirubrobacteraceae bacterium]|jgi:hypothetical protein|nr:hypothetical protein [Solirubrobacteraceae bacterium]